MLCYCANYYGQVNCQNKVSQFGERCKLCTVLNEGTSATYDLFKVETDSYQYDSEAVDDDDEGDSSRDENQRRNQRGNPRQRQRQREREREMETSSNSDRRRTAR